MTVNLILPSEDDFEEKLLLFSEDQTRFPQEERRDLRKYACLSKFITAMGNFSVQYNFQSISVALIMMSAFECTADDGDCKDGKQASWVASTASAAVFAGAIVGQLSMGYAGDVLGRNVAMIFTLSLVSIGALISAIAPFGSPTMVYAVIVAARFLLGIGAGGVYPLSATKAAEDGGDHSHGVDVHSAAFSFFWQVPGSMTPWLIALIFSNITDMSNDTKWRIVLGLGALPAAIVAVCSYVEICIKQKVTHEEQQTLKSVLQKDLRRMETDNVIIYDLLLKWSTWKKLIATGGGWFIYDVAYYGVNLFGGAIVSEINNTDDDNVSNDSSVFQVSQQQLIGLSMGIPACLAAILCLYFVTTRSLQIYGFLFIAFCFTLLAALFVPLRDSNVNLLFTLYCLLLFSLSFGPNLTTFVLPAQTFPKSVRSTFNGISAACGKLGAVVGVYMFGAMAEATTYPTVMAVCALISVIGAVVSYFFIEKEEDTDITTPLRSDDNSSALIR